MSAQEKSPWQRGFDDGVGGKPGPALPAPDASWADRLYSAGWHRGIDHFTAKREHSAKCLESPTGRHVLHNDWWCEHCGDEFPPHERAAIAKAGATQ